MTALEQLKAYEEERRKRAEEKRARNEGRRATRDALREERRDGLLAEIRATAPEGVSLSAESDPTPSAEVDAAMVGYDTTPAAPSPETETEEERRKRLALAWREKNAGKLAAPRKRVKARPAKASKTVREKHGSGKSPQRRVAAQKVKVVQFAKSETSKEKGDAK